MDIRTKRVYEPRQPQDGFRILVDRVWLRGKTKQQVGADLWLKDAAPSTALRKWFDHDQSKWKEFCIRYFVELDTRAEVVEILLGKAAQGSLTLLFSARDVNFNQAIGLREYLLSQTRKNLD